jgi:hypothetical protein
MVGLADKNQVAGIAGYHSQLSILKKYAPVPKSLCPRALWAENSTIVLRKQNETKVA